MPEIGYPVMEELRSQTDGREPLLYPGLEGQCQEVVSPELQKPEPSAGARTSGQLGPLREGLMGGGGGIQGGDTPTARACAEDREKGRSSLASPSSCPLPQFFCQ